MRAGMAEVVSKDEKLCGDRRDLEAWRLLAFKRAGEQFA